MTEAKRPPSIEARASRHVLGRISRGSGLQDALRGLVDQHGLRCAWVSAIGAFEWIELTEYSQEHRRYEASHRFERCELLSMQGNLSERNGEPFWHLHATVSLREGGRDLTYGGHVVDGVVFALEYRIDCFDGLTLRRTRDDATGLDLWADLDVAQDQGGEPGITWAMAAEASALVHPVILEENVPERGDWIDHPKFGLCKIEGMSGDGVCILKLPDGRRKKIKIDAMQVLAPRSDGDRRVFAVRPKARD